MQTTHYEIGTYKVTFNPVPAIKIFDMVELLGISEDAGVSQNITSLKAMVNFVDKYLVEVRNLDGSTVGLDDFRCAPEFLKVCMMHSKSLINIIKGLNEDEQQEKND